ncbi:WAT1-related protein At2g37460-like isoform X1 [Chenopodium quinoa]|uniref:WAT1-related protein At2g37460-like isoform X1 n=2 Tax=Chenopodium quinoa TaxID=63459 RepID=UPI000B7707AC|nr:WAT1-related protein At2g37460-like isoform X1 [Chenopodium quinoa]
MEATRSLYIRAKPFLAVIFLQIGLAGMDILSKVALNRGMSNYVLVVYRHAVATFIIAPFALVLDKKVRPKMTVSIFIKLLLLSLLEPVIDQNLYYMGMKYTSATFAATMVNILPAITFLMAWIMRLEVVKCRSLRSQAKIVGTVATVGGAMMMTLVKGPALTFLSKNSVTDHGAKSLDISVHDAIKGSIMITIGCFSWAAFVILQAITLNTYPVELSLTAWICLLGTLEGTAVALVMEKGRSHVWAIGWDANLLAAVYSGIFCSGLLYFIQGVVMKERGPVFVTAFSPLCMVIVAILSTFLMAEKMYLGRVFGAIVIVVGLYMVIWGKGKDYDTHTPPLDEDKTTDQNISTQIQLQGQVEDVNNNSHWLHINQDHIHV